VSPKAAPGGSARRWELDAGATVGRKAWAVLLGAALLLRAGWAVIVPVAPVSDGHAYDVLARTLALHGVYGWEPGSPTAYWPVGTSFLYSLAYRAFGLEYRPIAALNVALGVAVVALTTAVARRWVGTRAAVAAGWLVAVWPSLVEFTTVLASELPFLVLVLAALAVWPRGESRGGARAIATGVLLAGASYVRPTALLLPAVLALLAVAREREPVASVALRTAVVVAVMATCLAPWSIRNTRLFGRFVIVSTNAGTNTWMGNNPETTGAYMPEPELALNEAERDAYLGAEARRHILAAPGAFAARSAGKLVALHARESIGVTWNGRGLAERFGPAAIAALKLAGNAFWWGALASALAGAVGLALHRRWTALLAPAVIWGYFAALHAVTVIQDRYHFPSIPFIAALAGVAIVEARRALTDRAAGRRALDPSARVPGKATP
jgi:hypothetical protein